MDTLQEATNILDFCLTQNVGRQFHVEETKIENGQVTHVICQRYVRFYVSNRGYIIEKVHNENGSRSRMAAGSVVRANSRPLNSIRPIVSRITIHWPSFYNVVTGKTLALPNLIALQHIPLSPAGVIAKRPAPIALPNSCAAYTYGSLRFTPIKERAVIVCLWMYRVILLTRRGDGW